MPKDKQCLRSSCPISCGLDLLGDKWSLLIIRDLLLSNRSEYGHMLNAGEGISTNILSDRLNQLQKDDLIEKHPHPEHGKKFLYSLTDKGLNLAPIIIELALWADKFIDGAQIPLPLLERINQDREALIKRLVSAKPLFEFDFNAEEMRVKVRD